MTRNSFIVNLNIDPISPLLDENPGSMQRLIYRIIESAIPNSNATVMMSAQEPGNTDDEIENEWPSSEPQFVDKYYKMNPKIDTVLLGTSLKNGMRILTEDPYYRVDLQELSRATNDNYNQMQDKANRWNQWAVVSDIFFSENTKVMGFVGTYRDGTKRSIFVGKESGWYVKIDSIPNEEKLVVAKTEKSSEDTQCVDKIYSPGSCDGEVELVMPPYGHEYFWLCEGHRENRIQEVYDFLNKPFPSGWYVKINSIPSQD